MANITFEVTATTTTVTIPRWAPDIKWMQTTSAIVLEFPTTTWKGDAADNCVQMRRVNVIAWDTRTVNAAFSRATRALCHLKYRAVGELTR
jgi:hypothetical protein